MTPEEKELVRIVKENDFPSEVEALELLERYNQN